MLPANKISEYFQDYTISKVSDLIKTPTREKDIEHPLVYVGKKGKIAKGFGPNINSDISVDESLQSASLIQKRLGTENIDNNTDTNIAKEHIALFNSDNGKCVGNLTHKSEVKSAITKEIVKSVFVSGIDYKGDKIKQFIIGGFNVTIINPDSVKYKPLTSEEKVYVRKPEVQEAAANLESKGTDIHMDYVPQ